MIITLVLKYIMLLKRFAYILCITFIKKKSTTYIMSKSKTKAKYNQYIFIQRTQMSYLITLLLYVNL